MRRSGELTRQERFTGSQRQMDRLPDVRGGRARHETWPEPSTYDLDSCLAWVVVPPELRIPRCPALASGEPSDILALVAGQSYDRIYLSPHLDDAVLSCGASVYTQVRSGESVLVVTLFCASPKDPSLTAQARELRERWGSAVDPVAARRREDVRAMEKLGAEPVHLSFLDCVYRHGGNLAQAYYPTQESIFGDVHPCEGEWHHALAVALLAAVCDVGTAIIHAPLSVGHHVDHILVRRMGLLLLRQGHQVLFYEDYPYAADARTLNRAFAPWAPSCWVRHSLSFGEEAMAAKRDAVACYASQISTFWRDVEEMRRSLRERALAVGGGRYAENHWSLLADCLSA